MKLTVENLFQIHEELLNLESKYLKVIKEQKEDIEQLRFKLHLKDNPPVKEME